MDMRLNAPKAEMKVERKTDAALKTGGGNGGNGGGSKLLKVAGAALAVAAVAGGILFGGLGKGGQAADQVTQDQVNQHAAAYAAILAQGGGALTPVPPENVKAEAKGLGQPAAVEKQLLQDIDDGDVRMVYVGLYDWNAEDNDTVILQSSGISRAVVLTHKVQMVAIPVPAKQKPNIVMHGDHDGGGGITVGVVANGGANVDVPVMREGEDLNIPAQ